MEQDREQIRRIMIAVNLIDGIYDLAARRLKVKCNLLTLLYALDDGAAHTQKEICEEWCIPVTTVNTIVQECVKAGYVTLEASPHTREKVIRITPRGAQYARGILEPVYAMEQRAMERTRAACPTDLPGAIEAFARTLRQELDECICKESENHEPEHRLPLFHPCSDDG